MPKKNVRMKFAAFEAIAARLQAIEPSRPADTILCPICLGSFGREAITSGALTKEHILPESLGSAAWTLGCCRCNSDSKRNIESHLTKLLRYEDVMAGLSGDAVRGRIRAGDGEQRVQVKIEKAGPTVTLIGEPGTDRSPASRNLIRVLESGVPSFQLSVYGGCDRRLANLSLLKSAYLYMFREFGYDYILRPQLDVVRRQLRCPGEEIIPRAAIFRFSEAPPMRGERVTRFVITDPSFLVVALNISTAQARYCGVMLPSRRPTETHIYEIFTDDFAKKYPHFRLTASTSPFDMSGSDEW
jgi:hypothetical protein